jgi:glycerol uptake facilitator protein
MSSEFLGEFLGTFILIFMGNGVVAGVLLKKTYGENSGWLVITTAWGIAVICGVFVALAVGSNAHINPAVTIGFGFYTGEWGHVPTYIAGQLLGAIIGAVFVWLFYYPHWVETDDAASKRACYCTSPAIPHLLSNVFCEVMGTFVLVFVDTGLVPGLGPFLVGLLVWGIGMSLGGTTGYAINPARDLGPRLAHALLPIAGKGESGWSYAAVPVFGPLLGAAIAGAAAGALGM